MRACAGLPPGRCVTGCQLALFQFALNSGKFCTCKFIFFGSRGELLHLFFKSEEPVIAGHDDFAKIFDDIVSEMHQTQVSLRTDAAFFDIF